MHVHFMIITVEDKKVRVVDPDAHQICAESCSILNLFCIYNSALCTVQSVIDVAKNVWVESRERSL